MKGKENSHIAKFRSEKLHPEETIHFFLDGWIGKMMGKGDDKQHNGMFVLTDNRACFYRAGVFGEVLETIPIAKITSVDTLSSMGHRVLRLHAAHDALEFKTFEEKALFDKVYERLERLRHSIHRSETASAVALSIDPLDQLKKLAELRDAGILTEDEFAAKKGELLLRMSQPADQRFDHDDGQPVSATAAEVVENGVAPTEAAESSGSAAQVQLSARGADAAAVAALRIGEVVRFRHMKDHTDDPRAIAVIDADDRCLGYLPADHWMVDSMHDDDQPYSATVVSIGDGGVVTIEATERGKSVRAAASHPSANPAREKKHRRAGIGCLVVFVLGLLATSQCSDSESTDLSATNRSTSDDEMSDSARQIIWMEKGKDAIKAKLKDQDSAQFRNIGFYSGGGIPTVCGEVNAKNSFGGYAGFERFLAAGDVIAYTESQIQGGLGPAWSKYCVKGPGDPP